MAYERTWGRNTPGCLIFLLDQSGSMANKFKPGSVAEGQKLDMAVATQLNNCINEVGYNCNVEGEIRERVEIAVIGYGGNGVSSALKGTLAGRELVSIKELVENPLRSESRKKKEVDETGGVVEYEVEFNVWVEPASGGGTPMCEAFQKAYQIAEGWVAKHPDSFPPLVINLTDGVATDGDPRQSPAVKNLHRLETKDGNLLIFNCHISAEPGEEISYPGRGVALPQDQYQSAQQLFDTASEIPPSMRRMAEAMGIVEKMASDARGFLFNADVATVNKMLVFSTTPTIQQPNPNE